MALGVHGFAGAGEFGAEDFFDQLGILLLVFGGGGAVHGVGDGTDHAGDAGDGAFAQLGVRGDFESVVADDVVGPRAGGGEDVHECADDLFVRDVFEVQRHGRVARDSGE